MPSRICEISIQYGRSLFFLSLSFAFLIKGEKHGGREQEGDNWIIVLLIARNNIRVAVDEKSNKQWSKQTNKRHMIIMEKTVHIDKLWVLILQWSMIAIIIQVKERRGNVFYYYYNFFFIVYVLTSIRAFKQNKKQKMNQKTWKKKQRITFFSVLIELR